MSRSVRHIVNFFAFNLLFFSLYLNFIHKDSSPDLPEKKQQLTDHVNNSTALVNKPGIAKDQKTAEPAFETR